MSAGMPHGADLKALQEVLDCYGGNASRWPDGIAARFERLLQTDAAARAAVAEAKALDVALSRAPEVPAARRAALADRIVSEAIAARSRIEARPRAEVIDLASRRSASGRPAGTFSKPRWQAAAVLAASLMLGVFGGATGRFSSPLDEIATLVGLSADSDGLSVALNQAVEAPSEEDPL